MLAEGIDVEIIRGVTRNNFLLRQVNGNIQFIISAVHEFINGSLRQHNWQNAVFETVVEENVAVTRRDNAADTEIEQRPRRVFTA